MNIKNCIQNIMFTTSLFLFLSVHSQTDTIIKKLPNSFTIRNFNFTITNVKRGSGNTDIYFICRKISHSSDNFPFTPIKLTDDHGNEYYSERGLRFDRNYPKEVILQAMPLGFTWTCKKSVGIPDIAPIVKLDFIHSESFLLFTERKVVKSIKTDLSSIKEINIENELNYSSNSDFKTLQFNQKIKQSKYIEWYFKNIEDDLIPINVINNDYIPGKFQIFFLFQFPDGSLSPECRPELTSLNSGGEIVIRSTSYRGWVKYSELPAAQDTHIGNYRLPSRIVNDQKQMPKIMFVFNGDFIKENRTEKFMIKDVYRFKL